MSWYHDRFFGRGVDLQGSRFDDWLVGTDWADRIEAHGGDDTIEGFGGDDLLAGKNGDDVIYGDGGWDTLTGGKNRDWIDGGTGNDVIGGGDGSDTLLGWTGDDFIGGDADPDYLGGEAGNDTLSGGTADDTLEGGPGNDLLDGGPGFDIALYAGSGRGVERVRIGPDTVILRLPGGEVDRLVSVEAAEFADGVLDLWPATPWQAFVFRLYDAVYDRPADDGLDYWAGQMAAGMSGQSVAAAFLDSPEYAARFGADPSAGALIDRLYTNVLGREPDAGGRAYWEGRLAAGTTEVEMLLAFTESPENVAAHAEALDAGIFHAF